MTNSPATVILMIIEVIRDIHVHFKANPTPNAMIAQMDLPDFAAFLCTKDVNGVYHYEIWLNKARETDAKFAEDSYGAKPTGSDFSPDGQIVIRFHTNLIGIQDNATTITQHINVRNLKAVIEGFKTTSVFWAPASLDGVDKKRVSLMFTLLGECKFPGLPTATLDCWLTVLGDIDLLLIYATIDKFNVINDIRAKISSLPEFVFKREVFKGFDQSRLTCYQQKAFKLFQFELDMIECAGPTIVDVKSFHYIRDRIVANFNNRLIDVLACHERWHNLLRAMKRGAFNDFPKYPEKTQHMLNVSTVWGAPAKYGSWHMTHNIFNTHESIHGVKRSEDSFVYASILMPLTYGDLLAEEQQEVKPARNSEPRGDMVKKSDVVFLPRHWDAVNWEKFAAKCKPEWRFKFHPTTGKELPKVKK